MYSVPSRCSSFSTLKILATVKQYAPYDTIMFSFSTLKILATVKLSSMLLTPIRVLVPLRF